MNNKYLEKIAGFKGQSLRHIMNRQNQLQSAIDKQEIIANLTKPFKSKKAVLNESSRLTRAKGRFDRVESEISGRFLVDILNHLLKIKK